MTPSELRSLLGGARQRCLTYRHGPQPDVLPYLRAGDRDRDRAAQRLTTAYSEGYIDKDEFDTRLAAVYRLDGRHELRELVSDLPVPPPPVQSLLPARRSPSYARRMLAAGIPAIAMVVLGLDIASGVTTGAPLHSAMNGVVGGAIFFVAFIVALFTGGYALENWNDL